MRPLSRRAFLRAGAAAGALAAAPLSPFEALAAG
ncbi:MAG: twin-arginine translocation signal domain-containing protein, partial [Myxococcales bacterium]|nr:twin-arginine translocation signal domain-containing protein [Myxococcales bacterium]